MLLAVAALPAAIQPTSRSADCLSHLGSSGRVLCGRHCCQELREGWSPSRREDGLRYYEGLSAKDESLFSPDFCQMYMEISVSKNHIMYNAVFYCHPCDVPPTKDWCIFIFLLNKDISWSAPFNSLVAYTSLVFWLTILSYGFQERICNDRKTFNESAIHFCSSSLHLVYYDLSGSISTGIIVLNSYLTAISSSHSINT